MVAQPLSRVPSGSPASSNGYTFRLVNPQPKISSVIGVDFSGAALAGRNIWLARCQVARSQLRLTALERLEDLCIDASRAASYAHLIGEIEASKDALWGIDFPFGLPIELGLGDWNDQLVALMNWTDSANAFGRDCCDRAMKAVGKLHTRRDTDVETRTPFDCYHYRIIYQTFHGMRDVLIPLIRDKGTCVLPFQIDSLDTAKRVVVEACPGSTLRRLSLPFNRYKQNKPGKVEAKYIKVRRAILKGLESLIELDDAAIKSMLNNPGGDALDAVIAAVGVWEAWRALDLSHLRQHPRYRREGLVLC